MSLFSRVSKEEQLAFLNDVLPQAMDQGIMLTAEDIEELYDNQYFPQKAQEEWEEKYKNGGRIKRLYNKIPDDNPVKQTILDDNRPYVTNPDGTVSTHLMGSYGNYAIPLVQPRLDGGGVEIVEGNPYSRAMQTGHYIEFDRPRQAKYFAKHYKELPGLHIYDEGDELDGDDEKTQKDNIYSFYTPFRFYPELNSYEHIDRARPIGFVDRDLNVNEKVDPEDQWLPRYEHLSKEELLAAVEEFTKLYETFVPHVYRVKDKDGKETGPYLIGYGTQYYTDNDGNRRKVKEHDPDITEERARELLKREYERLYDSAIQNWANFDDFDNAIRMQALEAGYNTGTYHWTSDKSPNWRKMMDEYQMNHRWEDENYDINEVLQHGNWSVHDNPSSWLGVRANLRNYPYNIRIDDLEKRWSPMTENDRIEYIKEIQGR